MRRLLGTITLIGAFTMALVTPQIALAADNSGQRTVSSPPNIITITASVASQITVVVDKQGAISQIFSNSDQPAPAVFVKNNLEGARTQPTAKQIAIYHQIMQDKTIVYGNLYEKPDTPLRTWLSILKRPAVTIGS